MSRLWIRGDGFLVVSCDYDQRNIPKEIGGRWDGIEKAWTVAFTSDNLEYLIDNLDSPTVDPSVEERLLEQTQKEARLEKLREMAKQDVPVNLKVAGLKSACNLYNYQKLGVAYALTNGEGILVADDMGLGKTLQAIAVALVRKAKGLAKNCLVITPASLKFNWPLEIEKFTDEKYVVVDGSPDERIAQWKRTDVFFTIVNYELLLEDLFGGRDFKAREGDSEAMILRKQDLKSKAEFRKKVLADIRQRTWDVIVCDECFPYNTMIDTEFGRLPIGFIVENRLSVSVRCYDSLIHEPSYRKIVRWIDKPLVGNLVEVTHEFGKFVCTANHQIWTEERGYVQAGELLAGGQSSHLFVLPASVPSSRLSARVLQPELFGKACLASKEKIRGNNAWPKAGVGEGPDKDNGDLWKVSNAIFDSQEREGNQKILLNTMCLSVEDVSARYCGEDSCQSSHAGDCQELRRMPSAVHSKDGEGARKKILFSEMCVHLALKKRTGKKTEMDDSSSGVSQGLSGQAKSGLFKKNDRKKQGCSFSEKSVGWRSGMAQDSPIVFEAGRKAVFNRAAKEIGRGPGRWMDFGIQDFRPKIFRSDRLPSAVLSLGHCQFDLEDRCRGGRAYASNKQVEGDRCPKGEGFVLSGVESVKILERGCFERLECGRGQNPRVYNLEIEDLHNYIADGVLVSNCHALRSHSSRRSINVKSLNGRFRMALTGTPMDGRLEELHSVMEFVYPGLFESRTRFLQKHADTDFFGKITGYHDIDSVRKRMSNCFLRRLKKDVLKDLPDKIFENRIVVLSSSERDIYKKLASRGHEATKDAEAMVAVIRCKQFCDHPELIGESGKTSSKLESLREVLDEVVIENGHKVLVFSQYKQMVNILVRLFDEMNLKYLRIDGDTPKQSRADYQKQFNEDLKLDIMVGTGAMGAGLNFTSADYVVLYDQWWSNIMVDQAVDRAHRIGQKNTVTVITFTCKDTIEERIIHILKSKERVTTEALGDECDETVVQRVGARQIAALL